MKPFNASEFISNQETPVVTRSGVPVEVVTSKGRDPQPVLGYVGDLRSIQTWNLDGFFQSGRIGQWDLFFAPKVEVVHVYQYRDDPKGRYTFVQGGAKFGGNALVYTHLGTITGPIVPPEEGK